LSRQKLIKQLKEKNPKLNRSEIVSIIDIFSETISKALREGKAVEIRNLGRFFNRKLKENFNARNPSSNELIYTPERVKIKFKASKKLKKIINE